MRLLNQSCEAFIQEPGLEGIYKQIERAGRTCYKSTDKITSESAKPFVDRMIKSKHYAMLEHGTVYLDFPPGCYENRMIDSRPFGRWEKYASNKYSYATGLVGNGHSYVTTNMRVIVENGWERDLDYLCIPTEYHKKRYTLSCTTALHCYKDLTRHRVFSFAIESTRYCNYSKDKFGNELAFIVPTWCEIPVGNYPCHLDDETATFVPEGWNFKDKGIHGTDKVFLMNLGIVEHDYKTLTEYSWQAQQAAEVLPQCIKGDMIITGFEDDWKHLLDLRYYGTTGAPHPMVQELATLMKGELENLGFIY